MKLNKAFLVFTLLLNNLAYSQKQSEWKLSKVSDGVKIYFRKSPDSNIKEVMGLTSVKTSLGALVYIVKDSENHHKWIYANKNARLLKSISNFEWIYYNESEAPWPVSNRDLITHARMKQDSSSLKIRIDSEGLPNYLPHKKDLVRVPNLYSVWVFTPKSAGYVDIRFELKIDLGGNIPAWLINLSIDRGPLETLKNMSKIAQQEKFKTMKLPYIREKINE